MFGKVDAFFAGLSSVPLLFAAMIFVSLIFGTNRENEEISEYGYYQLVKIVNERETSMPKSYDKAIEDKKVTNKELEQIRKDIESLDKEIDLNKVKEKLIKKD